MTTILEQWIQGKGLPNTCVIDGHIHIGEWPHAATFHTVDEAASESLRHMDSHGIDAICAVSGGYIFGLSDYHLGNDLLLSVWKRIPERLIPFMSINPNDQPEQVLAELQRMWDAGVRCIKLINSYQANYPGNGPTLMRVYAFAARNPMLVFNHYWSEPEINQIAAQFPEVDFIFGHYGGGFQDTAMNTYTNVYSNIWSYGPMGWLDRGIQQVGAHKLMLGSDGFLNCLSVGIGPVVFAPISDAEKQLILGRTIARLVDKVGGLPNSLRKLSGLTG